MKKWTNEESLSVKTLWDIASPTGLRNVKWGWIMEILGKTKMRQLKGDWLKDWVD